MPSSFFGLNIGATGLYTYQAALDTTAHNITNTETEGYTRQVMGQKASKALKVNSKYGMAGTGVDVSGVKQLRDSYYDMKYWKNNTMYGDYSSKQHYMTEIENYFNEVKLEGFTTSFNSMFNSIQELADNPSNESVRTQMINYAKSMTEYFNFMANSLEDIQEECNFEIRNKVDQINSTSQQIAMLTKKINTLEVGGGTANDLRDQRALLIDKLTEVFDISVTEKVIGDGVGINSYIVKVQGQTLVDGSDYNKMKVVPREDKLNQNDIDGLYDIAWENGQIFDTSNNLLGGSLQAIFEVRDGNDLGNFRGTVTADVGDEEVVVENLNIKYEEKLNIPEQGLITLGDRQYKYNGFKITKDPTTGEFISAAFALDEPVRSTLTDTKVKIGEEIPYKGIPYYLGQLNEFVRTFSKAFNNEHRKGKDLSNEWGNDFFNATNKISGRNYTFDPLNESPDHDFYDYSSLSSQTGDYAEEVPDGQPLYGSYYFMTAKNLTITDTIFNDPRKLATGSNIVDGVEQNDVVDNLIKLKSNNKMFWQGNPAGYLQSLVAEVGIDSEKATNFAQSQDNVLKAISNQRLSVSGVDIDEEAMNLVKFQNAYNLSAKVITTMDEIYDKLINYMGA